MEGRYVLSFERKFELHLHFISKFQVKMVEIKISLHSDEFRFKRSSEFSLRCEEKRQLFEISKLIALSYELSIDSVTFDFTKLYLSQNRISSKILDMKISTFHETLFTPRKMNFPENVEHENSNAFQ